jgi:DNA-directed RNA polymerase subunit RPC12/RpoP
MSTKTFYKISPNIRPVCTKLNKKKDVCSDVCEDSKYFLRRLQKHDKEFSNKKDLGSYSKNCQTASRQPVVLNYNPEKKKSIKRDSFTETLEFSTDSKKKYYICPKYWCPFCEIPVSESDIDKRTITKKIDMYYNCKTAKCPYCEKRIFVKESESGEVYSYPKLLKDRKAPCCFKKL